MPAEDLPDPIPPVNPIIINLLLCLLGHYDSKKTSLLFQISSTSLPLLNIYRGTTCLERKYFRPEFAWIETHDTSSSILMIYKVNIKIGIKMLVIRKMI